MIVFGGILLEGHESKEREESLVTHNGLSLFGCGGSGGGICALAGDACSAAGV